MKTIKLLLVALPFILSSCSKGGGTPAPNPPTPPTPTEANITFTVDKDPGAGSILGVVGTSQPIVVKVTSALPAAGVTINVQVTKDADNSSVFSNSNSSVTVDNNVNIAGLTPGVLCTATIVVTSKSTITNTKSASFKLAAK